MALARFLQLRPNEGENDALCEVLDALSQRPRDDATPPPLALLPATAMDDLVLLSLHKLLLGYVADSRSQRVQEKTFGALRVVLERSADRAQSSEQKLLGFVQWCVAERPCR